MAGSFKVTLDVEGRGPLFDGRADAALQDWARATTKAIADEGVAMLRAVPMNKTGRARGNFQANLHVLQRGGNGTEAQIPAPMIRGVTWGPWLEGTSQRNDSTRFRGYHLFRQTRQALQKLAPGIGQAELEKILPRIGGTP